MDLWAVVPVKERVCGKGAPRADAAAGVRQALALAMLEDVLAALAATPGLAGLLVVTVDPEARRSGGELRRARDRSRAPATAIPARSPRRRGCSRAEGRAGMLTLPGDIPLVTAAEIASLFAAHRPAPVLHDRPVARRARLERDRLLAARCRAVALWREQFLPASCRRPRRAASGRTWCICRGSPSTSTTPRILYPFADPDRRRRAWAVLAENACRRRRRFSPMTTDDVLTCGLDRARAAPLGAERRWRSPTAPTRSR